MSRTKKFIICLVLSIFIGVGLFFAFKKPTPSQAVLSSSSSAYQEKISQLNPELIQKIEFRAGTEVLALTKKDGVWLVNNKRAKSGYIEELFKVLKPETPPSVVPSTNDFSPYGLMEEATRITFDDSLSILLGGYSDKGSYVRFTNDSIVYDLENAASVKMDPQNWYEKSVISFDQTHITKLSLKTDNTSVDLLKKNGRWINQTNNTEVKQDKVENVLSVLSKLSALVVIDESQNFTYPTTAPLTVTVGNDMEENTLELYQGTIELLVRRLRDDQWFIVRDPNTSAITTAPYDIF